MKNSKKYSLNYYDAIKAVIMLFITSLLAGVVTSLNAGHLPVKWADWQPIVMTSLCATIAYVIKQFFTANGDTTTNP